MIFKCKHNQKFHNHSKEKQPRKFCLKFYKVVSFYGKMCIYVEKAIVNKLDWRYTSPPLEKEGGVWNG